MGLNSDKYVCNTDISLQWSLISHLVVSLPGRAGEDWEALHHVWRWHLGKLQANQWGRSGLLHSRLRPAGGQAQSNTTYRRYTTLPTNLWSICTAIISTCICISWIELDAVRAGLRYSGISNSSEGIHDYCEAVVQYEWQCWKSVSGRRIDGTLHGTS